MSVEARQGSQRAVRVAAAPPSTARRIDGFAHDRAIGQVPIEIAFLASYGVPPNLLLKAAAKARAVDVSADRALLGAGFPEDTFYRLLARHLGMPYLDQPMRLSLPPGMGASMVSADTVALAPNARHLDRVLAPRGKSLATLLGHYQPGQGRDARTAIVSPRCLKALIRRQTRPALLFRATEGLASWDHALSAKGGFAPGQILAGVALSAAAAAGFVAAPGTTLVVLAIAVSSLFFIAVLLKLAATAMSVVPRAPGGPRIPEHALPIYTVVVPLLREAAVVPRLIASLETLDYPDLCRKRNKSIYLRCN